MHCLLGNNKKSSENNKIKSTLLSPLAINYELHNRWELKKHMNVGDICALL
jgi:hypothetical protein